MRKVCLHHHLFPSPQGQKIKGERSFLFHQLIPNTTELHESVEVVFPVPVRSVRKRVVVHQRPNRVRFKNNNEKKKKKKKRKKGEPCSLAGRGNR